MHKVGVDTGNDCGDRWRALDACWARVGYVYNMTCLNFIGSRYVLSETYQYRQAWSGSCSATPLNRDPTYD